MSGEAGGSFVGLYLPSFCLIKRTNQLSPELRSS